MSTIHFCACGQGIHSEMAMCPKCEEADIDGQAFVTIGRYTLRPFHGNSVWLENDDGEGMQIPGCELEKILQKYWKEYF